jgi:hypothetical protein
MNASERAARLSALLHLRFNHEGNVMSQEDFDLIGLSTCEENLFWRSLSGIDPALFEDNAFWRLGCEIRQIHIARKNQSKTES